MTLSKPHPNHRPLTRLGRTLETTLKIPSHPTVRAFTLVELLVLVAIVAILAAMRLPALSRAELKAKEVHCLSNVMQLGHAHSVSLGDFHKSFQYACDRNLWMATRLNWIAPSTLPSPK